MSKAPLTIGRLAQAAGVNVETVRYYQRIRLVDEPGKPARALRTKGQYMPIATLEITGILGLSLNAHSHRFTVEGVAPSTRCAVDTLFLPAMLDAMATVESRWPVSGSLVRLEVAPGGIVELAPAHAAGSPPVLRADEVDTSSTEGIWSAFCHRIYFFVDREEAAKR